MIGEGSDLGASFGAHVYLWAADSSTDELDGAIRAAAALDLDFVQVSLSSLDLDLSFVKASLERHHLGCLAGLAIPPNVWSRRRDGALRAYLKKALEATARLDCGMLSGALYTPMGEKSGPRERREELRLLRGDLKEAAQYASGARHPGRPRAPQPLRDITRQHLRPDAGVDRRRG